MIEFIVIQLIFNIIVLLILSLFIYKLIKFNKIKIKK